MQGHLKYFLKLRGFLFLSSDSEPHEGITSWWSTSGHWIRLSTWIPCTLIHPVPPFQCKVKISHGPSKLTIWLVVAREKPQLILELAQSPQKELELTVRTQPCPASVRSYSHVRCVQPGCTKRNSQQRDFTRNSIKRPKQTICILFERFIFQNAVAVARMFFAQAPNHLSYFIRDLARIQRRAVLG